jgi:peptide/nickel transport system substrate-binding protein
MFFRQLAAPLRILLLVFLLVACERAPVEPTSAGDTPRPTAAGTLSPGATTTAESETARFITVATDAPSRFRDFEDIDEFGTVVGFDPDLMADIAAGAGLEHEFVVTSFSGLLTSVSYGEFDVAMSALVIPEEPAEGVVYTAPYLEIGQVLLVRANETELESAEHIGPQTPIGVQRYTNGEQTARELLGLAEPQLLLYDSTTAAIQALIDGQIQGAIIDSDDAEQFAGSFSQQLKVAGGEGQAAWITRRAYGMAVAADNQELLAVLNEGIQRARDDGTIERLTREWLVAQGTIAAGESLIGTPANELVIGIAGTLADLDPAAREPDLVSWEVKANTMSGLLMYDAQNRLVPVLAADFPTISEDKLEYTFQLRPGLIFPDDTELTAEDVRFSISRAAGLGNFQVNSVLKDADDDKFADADAVQVIDAQTVKFVLKAPTAYFPSLLATPPFYVVSQECFAAEFDAASTCGGIGRYTIAEWEAEVQIRLTANPQWPGPTPAFDNIQLRFYDDPARMRVSLENNAIDMAWTGLPYGDRQQLSQNRSFRSWSGPAGFKSYLVFEQAQEPWEDARVREAVALAVDRPALAEQVFGGGRLPLRSPVPDGTPGQVPAEPERDLASARSILSASGYSPSKKLEMTIWYVNDGRYSDREDAYAAALKQQLEETELIAVTLESASYGEFRPQSAACAYPAFILGWPPLGQPAAFLDPMSWMDYFITGTDTICSNYDSEAMTALYEQALQETDETARLAIYQQMQERWAREFPTLDLLQEPRLAISRPNVSGVAIDAMGLMHYEELNKSG